MLREFTKDLGRYKSGEVKDYPEIVWRQIANGEGKKLDSFTKKVEAGTIGTRVTTRGITRH